VKQSGQTFNPASHYVFRILSRLGGPADPEIRQTI
jgi:hypothetical protein